MARLALALVMAVALWGAASCQTSGASGDVQTVVTQVVSTVADRLANGDVAKLTAGVLKAQGELFNGVGEDIQAHATQIRELYDDVRLERSSPRRLCACKALQVAPLSTPKYLVDSMCRGLASADVQAMSDAACKAFRS